MLFTGALLLLPLLPRSLKVLCYKEKITWDYMMELEIRGQKNLKLQIAQIYICMLSFYFFQTQYWFNSWMMRLLLEDTFYVPSEAEMAFWWWLWLPWWAVHIWSSPQWFPLSGKQTHHHHEVLTCVCRSWYFRRA